jgi:hypothetical protein
VVSATDLYGRILEFLDRMEDILASRTCVAKSESAGELRADTVTLRAPTHALSALRQHTHEDI